jgi:hypothetical protein
MALILAFETDGLLLVSNNHIHYFHSNGRDGTIIYLFYQKRYSCNASSNQDQVFVCLATGQ